VSDEELFADAMRTVRRLSRPEKVQPEGSKPPPRPVAGTSATHPAASLHPSAHLRPEPHEAGVLIADGVSRERLKRLAAGDPPISHTLDLHGMTRDEAIGLLAGDFASVVASGARAMCVIHGRGRHSEGKPVLKEAVYHWLQEGPFAPHVLAVVPQPGSHGGACLILLRRN